jgi:MoaA/NifB/PqqE/SkfB family radical SAM enzyme
MKFLKSIKSNVYDLISPAFQWLQVEVSSLCNSACAYCPHTVYKSAWQGLNMSLDTFLKLEPVLKRTQLVYLQGWGEPFLNPDFFKMAKIAKDAGCRTGTTTNGILVDEGIIEKIIESELDLITFSVAGLGETNDNIRRKTSFNQILKTIDHINDIKSKRGVVGPAIHIAYLLLRSNLDEIKRIPESFSGYKIDQIVISTLDYIPDKSFIDESISPGNESEYRQFADILDRIVENGKNSNLEIHYYLSSPKKTITHCTENPRYAMYISADGSVSPCVFLNIPVSDIGDLDSNIIVTGDKLVFGNIRDESPASIWRKKEYLKFRQSFGSDNLYHFCKDCPKIHMEVC